jgi:hypothetical protein
MLFNSLRNHRILSGIQRDILKIASGSPIKNGEDSFFFQQSQTIFFGDDSSGWANFFQGFIDNSQLGKSTVIYLNRKIYSQPLKIQGYFCGLPIEIQGYFRSDLVIISSSGSTLAVAVLVDKGFASIRTGSLYFEGI